MNHTPARYLSDATEYVRQFNIESRSTTREGWQYPSDAYPAIGELVSLASLLAQAIDQSTLPVRTTHGKGHLAVSGGRGADRAVQKLMTAADKAVKSIADLTKALDAMHTATRPMSAGKGN